MPARIKLLNYGTFFAARFFLPLSVLIMFSVVSRSVSVEGFSGFIFLYSIGVIYSGLADGGERDRLFSLLRCTDRTGEVQFAIDDAILTKRIFSSALVGLTAAVAFSFSLNPDYILWALYGSLMPVADINLTVIRALHKAHAEIVFTLFELLVSVVLIAFVFAAPYGVDGVAFSLIVAAILRVWLTNIYLGKIAGYVWRRKPFSGKDAFRRARSNFTSALTIFSGNLYNRIPAIALVSAISPSVYGYYFTFLLILQRLEFIPTAVLQATFKRGSGVDLNRILSFSAISSLLVGFAVAVFFIFFGEFFVSLIASSPRAGDETAYLLLACAAPFIYLAFASRYFMQLVGKARISLLILVIFSGVQFLVFGFAVRDELAASAAYLALMFFYALVLFFCARKYHGVSK